MALGFYSTWSISFLDSSPFEGLWILLLWYLVTFTRSWCRVMKIYFMIEAKTLTLKYQNKYYWICPQVQHRDQNRWRPLVWSRRSTSQLWFRRHLWGRSTRIPRWATPWRASTPSSCRRRAVTGWWYRTPLTPSGGTPIPSPGLSQRWEAVVVRWNVCMQCDYQLVKFNIDYLLLLLLNVK